MPNNSITAFVVGATGATGKHVVKQLLRQGFAVKVVVRSKEKMLSLLEEDDSKLDTSKLYVTEASFLDVSDKQCVELIQGCAAAVCCLGHNLTFKGMYGSADKGLVTKSTQKLTKAIEKANPRCKFILMGTDGVSNPTKDNQRSTTERVVLFLLRYLVPPHYDNEAVAEYMLNDVDKTKIEWSIVRPTDLQNGEVSKYKIYEKPPGGLFGDGICTRANCASFMVKLITDSKAWEEYKYEMPVIHDEAREEGGEAK